MVQKWDLPTENPIFLYCLLYCYPAALFLFFPGGDLLAQPLGKFFNALAGARADGDDLHVGVEAQDVLTALVEIEVEIGQHVDLVTGCALSMYAVSWLFLCQKD